MTESEVTRAVQDVAASTSYGRETVSEVIRTGLAEMTALATTSSLQAGRETILAYVCQWTIKQTGYPEPLVWEVLGYVGRWLDELYDTIARDHSELLRESDR